MRRLRQCWLAAALTLAVATAPALGASQQPDVIAIRALSASPDQFANRIVTVVGRFRGRSVFDDASGILPPLEKSPWDFVLRSNDGGVWISGMRPRGDNFDLSPTSAVDAKIGRWLEVLGIVRVEKGWGKCTGTAKSSCTQIWIEAMSIRAVTPQGEVSVDIPAVRQDPPRVIFNDPLAGETDVPVTTAIRVQFSRDMNETAAFSNHVRVSYIAAASPPLPKFAVTYQPATRSMEIRFAAPLERNRQVKVELLEGLTSRDGQPLAPWSFSFTTGR